MLKASLLAVFLALAAGPHAADPFEAVRKTVPMVEKGLVTVRLVWKMTMSFEGDSQSREMKREVVGTTIDQSGLTLVCLGDADPTAMMAAIMPGDSAEYKASATDVKIIDPEGRQIPGKVVLRDRDLNLMFIRPLAVAPAPMPYVKLVPSGQAKVLDTVVVLSRLGKTLNRATGAVVMSVMSVLEKPRKLFVLDRAVNNAPGNPVFNLLGQPLGIATYKLANVSTESRGEGEGFGGARSLVAIPGNEVMRIARQVPSEEKAGRRQSAPAKSPAEPVR